ncbi:hypothetical protein RB653_009052 [Dictyostelium firmibasis]|uniref:N-acetyltransferase domain-containing protein n=1 Tax=Dictyostelium firmibasis TaxID=79012 RepID=A0AAN7U1B1_9MYCE
MDIKEIKYNEFTDDIKQELIQLMIECTEFGDLGFTHPLSKELSTRYWDKIENELREDIECRVLLIATIKNDQIVDQADKDDKKINKPIIVGSIQLSWDTLYNVCTHRGEVQKLMVKQSYQGKGLSKLLLTSVEELAIKKNKVLLILDTNSSHSFSSQLYIKMGYSESGSIPMSSTYNNTFSATNHFHKILKKNE